MRQSSATGPVYNRRMPAAFWKTAIRWKTAARSIPLWAALMPLSCLGQNPPPQVMINAPYVTTPGAVIMKMLRLANVNRTDVLYDLGSGDGRIVIAAARSFGARGVGIELNQERIQRARENARRAGVLHLVTFRREDFFESDLREATVVTLYLLPAVNLALRPKLLRELKPGARIVSNCFDMGDWKPSKQINVDGCKIYFWSVPAGGTPPN